MWIVLLDHSDSMGDPFEHSGDSSRRTRTVDAEIKLEAAKEVLREELAELREIDPDLAVAIFAFTSEARLMHAGVVADLDSINRALGSLSPENGTDIAAALNAAADHTETLTEAGPRQVMLISDGKSDRVEAMAAARRCLEHGLALSMLLIDPTDEGKAFARDVVRAVGGTYQSVTSRTSLRDATKGVVDSYVAGQARAAEYLEAAGREAQSVEKETADRERATFTAGYPGRMVPGGDYLLRVYLHLETQREEVLRRLEQVTDQFGVHPRTADTAPNQRIPIGTPLEVSPRINRIAVTPAQQHVTWVGSIEELSFRIFYAGREEDPTPCSGFIDISTSGLLLAQIPVSIQVEAGDFQLERRTAELISRVFASYSHEDEPIVRACKAAYRGLGIQLFVDKDDILSGAAWRDVIRRSIANHDLFQLFWSQAAADSDEVANEWRLAAEIAPTRTIDFIRPVYWEKEMPKPPDDLRNLNFARLDLGSLRLRETEGGRASLGGQLPSRLTRLEGRFPILETVGSGPTQVPRLQEEMARVVPFLEDLIGVRYFPPVTFVVDDHDVSAVREVLTTDLPDDDEDVSKPVLEILQALALEFHVGGLANPGLGSSERAAFFEVFGGEAGADYDHVVAMAEYVFGGPTMEHLAGKDVLAEGRRSLRELLAAVLDDGYGYPAADIARQALAHASPNERTALAETLKELDSGDDSKKKVAAARLLDSDLPRLAEQYHIFEFFHRSTPHSLRRHTRFPEYLADLVQHWLDYVEVARSKRQGAVVHVGFSVPESALRWLRERFPDIQLRVSRMEDDWRGEPSASFGLHIDDYKRCVEELSELLFSELSKAGMGRIAKLVNTFVSTHGIYIPMASRGGEAQVIESLAGRGWPRDAALPGQHKVLLCMRALDRLQEELQELGLEEDEAADRARLFSLSVLVHEHFHAAVATGLDHAGRSAPGAEHPERWETASALNESLAAWCERHFFRSDPWMLDRIDGYIASGAYPVWPYRGAQAVEAFYAAGGTPAVRGWMRHLRDDPENAQREFDQRFDASQPAG